MYIRYTTESSRRWSVTPDEEAFLAALEAALRQGHKSVALTISRMANGALSVSSPRAYLGKVKLQGRKTWMQYIVRNDAKSIEGAPLEEYIHNLNFWVRSA